jgi:hypothetical protein
MSEVDTREAWVKIATPTERAATLAKDSPYNFGFVPAMDGLIVAHREIGAQFFGLYQQIMFAPGALSRAEREMTAAVAAAAQDCFY